MLNYNLLVEKADIYHGYLQSRATDDLNDVEHVIREISMWSCQSLWFLLITFLRLSACGDLFIQTVFISLSRNQNSLSLLAK